MLSIVWLLEHDVQSNHWNLFKAQLREFGPQWQTAQHGLLLESAAL